MAPNFDRTAREAADRNLPYSEVVQKIADDLGPIVKLIDSLSDFHKIATRLCGGHVREDLESFVEDYELDPVEVEVGRVLDDVFRTLWRSAEGRIRARTVRQKADELERQRLALAALSSIFKRCAHSLDDLRDVVDRTQDSLAMSLSAVVGISPSQRRRLAS
jgi:hypothetical protein